MYRLVFILILFSSVRLFSQDTLNSKIVEEKSYKLYTEKKWNELIEFGNLALEKGFDYYYLRMRLGIAYYEKKNYRSAQSHFFKALSFNSNDDTAMEYIYYCYLYSWQYDAARKFSKNFSPSLIKKFSSIKSSAIDFLMLEIGVKSTTQQDLSNGNYFLPAAGFHLGKKISFFSAATLFNQNGTRQNLNQKQFFLSASIPVKKSWNISPAFHYIDRTISFNRPPLPPNYQPWMPPPPQAPPSSTANYFVSSLEVKKSISYLDIALGSAISNIDSIKQAQGNLSLSYFPFGNNNLFFTSTGYAQKESVSSDLKYAFSQSISVMFFSKIIISANYLTNQAHHLNEMNAYLVNNSQDLTSSRITLMGNFILSSRLSFYLLYQSENKIRNDKQNNIITNYSYNNFIGGLKFTL